MNSPQRRARIERARRLRSIAAASPLLKRRFGVLKGQIAVGPEFFEPLPEDETIG
jgi:hypothetical protein